MATNHLVSIIITESPIEGSRPKRTQQSRPYARIRTTPTLVDDSGDDRLSRRRRHRYGACNHSCILGTANPHDATTLPCSRRTRSGRDRLGSAAQPVGPARARRRLPRAQRSDCPRARRKPRKLPRNSGVSQLRLANRAYRGSRLQLPPRITRDAAAPGPCGSTAGDCL
jgi:hypothetical protein